jgi:hypothetical protein
MPPRYSERTEEFMRLPISERMEVLATISLNIATAEVSLCP